MPSAEPILVTFDQFVETMPRERINRADALAMDVLYDNVLRDVDRALQEPRKVDPVIALSWLSPLLLWLPLVIIGFEVLR